MKSLILMKSELVAYFHGDYVPNLAYKVTNLISYPTRIQQVDLIYRIFSSHVKKEIFQCQRDVAIGQVKYTQTVGSVLSCDIKLVYVRAIGSFTHI